MPKYDKLKNQNMTSGNKNKILMNPEIIKKIDTVTEQEFKKYTIKKFAWTAIDSIS